MPLRPYQLTALDRCSAAYAAGARAVVLVCPTGGGKTIMAAEAARRCRGTVLWMAHRTELIAQAQRTLAELGLDHVTVSSIQTLRARKTTGSYKLVVWDECVTGDTIVGGKRADHIRVGDHVQSWDGDRVVLRPVVRTMVNTAHTLLTIMCGGTRLTVTHNHPILVHGKGYVQASAVRPGDMCRLLSHYDVRRVDGVEIHEPGCDGTFGGRCPGGLVYNFEVAGEHNYYANGILTHNCHHAASDDWSALRRTFGSAYYLGLTATPQRGDGRGLEGLFDELVVAASVRELTDAGHLVPCTVVAPPRALDSGTIAQHPVDAYRDSGEGRKTILFAPHVQAAKQYCNEFIDAGIPAAVLHSNVEVDERSSIVDRYRRGDIRILCNVYLLTEGFDDPQTSCAILARGAGSAGLYLQMVGRILRPADGKRDAVLIDLRGVSHTHGQPDSDWQYSLRGRGIRVGEAAGPTVPLCSVCGALLDPQGTCPDCGYARTLAMPRIVGTTMERFASKRLEGPTERARTLSRWLGEARSRGYARGWAMHRYRATYGAWPPPDVVRLAGDHR